MWDRWAVKRAADGDGAAFSRIVDEHYPHVLRALVLLTGSQEDGLDLCQQTFLAARESLAAFRHESSLRTWLRKIAFNAYLKSKRSTCAPGLALLADMPVTSGLSTDALVLADAIAKLAEDLRCAFVLRVVEGHSVHETAEILGIPAGTVKSRCHAAKRRLRQQLATAWNIPIETQEIEDENNEAIPTFGQ